MTSRAHRKQQNLARKIRVAEVEMAISFSRIERSTTYGRPLKPGRTEPGIPVCARVERSRLDELQRLTGRSPSDVLELGLRMLHAHVTGDTATYAAIAASLYS